MKGLDGCGQRGQPHRNGRAALDLAVAAHHRLCDAADDPLGPGLDANGLRSAFGGRSVLPGGDDHGQRDLGAAETGPGLLHGRRCGLRRIGVGRERRADPHFLDPTPVGSLRKRKILPVKVHRRGSLQRFSYVPRSCPVLSPERHPSISTSWPS
jgi:hypothetical protein